MSIFVIKIIAYISMFVDHIKYAIPETQNFVTLYLGRLAFPLFAFLLTEGYVHTKNLKKYYIRLIVFALISQLPYMLFRSMIGDFWKLNILFTLLLGLMAINLYDKFEFKFVGIAGFFIFASIGYLLPIDYGWYGVLLIILFYLFKENKVLLTINFWLLNYIYMMSNFNWDINLVETTHYITLIFMNIPIIFVLLYNEKLGRKFNFLLYYLIYPIHMILLYAIYLLV